MENDNIYVLFSILKNACVKNIGFKFAANCEFTMLMLIFSPLHLMSHFLIPSEVYHSSFIFWIFSSTKSSNSLSVSFLIIIIESIYHVLLDWIYVCMISFLIS